MIRWLIYDKIDGLRILYATKFIRQYRELPKALQRVANKRGVIFKRNPFDSQLKTHKLSGRLDGFYAFWVNYKFRVIFRFESKDMVRFYEIGDHDIYE